MILHPTTAFIDKVGVSLGPDDAADRLLAWRVHYAQGRGYRFVVFLNEATQFVVVVNPATAATLRRLPERFREVLSETLLGLGVNPAVVDRYLAELGDVAYAKNTDRKITAQITHATRELSWAVGRYDDSAELSRWCSSRHVNITNRPADAFAPKTALLDALGRYGLPVRQTRAFDLTARLRLESGDAVRRLRVPATMTFERLHVVLQRAFGWTDSHLHSFGLFRQWGDYDIWPSVELVIDAEEEEPRPGDVVVRPLQGVKLFDYVPEYTKILYTYDFGDNWRHYIEVDDVVDDCHDALPLLLAGEGDAPPEDVGGSGGWAEFLAIRADPDHPDHEDMAAWARSQLWRPFDFHATAGQIANVA